MGQLQGKTAVILGAASEGNMGQTIARLFAKEGAKVMVAGRKEAPLAALAKEIGGMEGRLKNPKFVESAPEEVVEETRELAAQKSEEAAILKAALQRLAEIG